jgi:hypothetical protein
MALDITERLRRLDPADPVKYDFALHRMGLWKKADEIRSLRAGPALQPSGGPDTSASGAPWRNRRRAVSLS